MTDERDDLLITGDTFRAWGVLWCGFLGTATFRRKKDAERHAVDKYNCMISVSGDGLRAAMRRRRRKAYAVVVPVEVTVRAAGGRAGR